MPDSAKPDKSGGVMVVAADRATEPLAERVTDSDDEDQAEDDDR